MEKNETDVIILCGLDGSGKTTQAELLIDYLLKHNLKCKYVWLRFPNKLSLPFAGFVRLLGKSVYPLSEKKRLAGYSNLENNKWLQSMWKKFFLFDLRLINFFRITRFIKKDYTLVIDRFVFDSIIDQTIVAGKEAIDQRMLEEFLKLIPPNSKIFYLDIDPSISYKRNQDENIDTIKKRRKLYLDLTEKIDISIIDGNESIEQIHSNILKSCDFD